MAKDFASKADLEEKQISFTKLAEGAYAYTAQGDPNSGVIIGDEAVMVIDAQATPMMARDVIKKVKSVTDKPIKYVLLTHYHAVRVLGASAYGAEEIIASSKTLEMIKERGEQDWKSEFERFPRLFKGSEEISGLTWPTKTFKKSMTVDLGNKLVEVHHLGEGHTRGDAVAWLPNDKVLFAGDLVEYGATPYCGDAQLKHWRKTLQLLAEMKPQFLVPGRGDALTNAEECQQAIASTKSFVKTLFKTVKESVQRKESLDHCYKKVLERMTPKFGQWVIFEHCMPFNVSRAYDEASGIEHPRVWTAERDLEMWQSLNK